MCWSCPGSMPRVDGNRAAANTPDDMEDMLERTGFDIGKTGP